MSVWGMPRPTTDQPCRPQDNPVAHPPFYTFEPVRASTIARMRAAPNATYFCDQCEPLAQPRPQLQCPPHRGLLVVVPVDVGHVDRGDACIGTSLQELGDLLICIRDRHEACS